MRVAGVFFVVVLVASACGSTKANTVRQSFRSGHSISRVAGCSSDDAKLDLSAEMWVCKPGVGARFPSADSVTCSAAFLHATGKTAHLNLFYKGKSIGQDTYQLLHPLSVWGEQFFAPGLIGHAKFPTGPYVCVFSMGKELARRSFTLTDWQEDYNGTGRRVLRLRPLRRRVSSSAPAAEAG